MTADFRVVGAEQLREVTKALKTQGNGPAVRKELLKSIQASTKPLRRDMQLSAFGELPSRGGLNAVVAASTFGTRTRTTGNSAGVTLTVTGKKVRDIRAIDKGRLRHPVFGNRAEWVTQTIRPGVFTDEFQRGAPAVRKELLKALEQVVANIARSSR